MKTNTVKLNIDGPIIRRKPHPEEIKAVEEARTLFFTDEDLVAAHHRLDAVMHDAPHPRLMRFKARLCLASGEEELAKEYLKPVFALLHNQNPWEMTLTGAPCAKAVVNTDYKLAYVPVPKTGSTSLKNFFWELAGHKACGEDIHEQSAQLEMISHSDWRLKYAEYERMLVVRDPVKRLVSYFQGNIIERKQLVVLNEGKSSFYGLPTMPTWEFFLDHFHEYRRMFIVVRHHVEPTVTRIGGELDRFSWIGSVAQLDGKINELRDRLGMAHIQNVRQMTRKDKPEFAFSTAHQDMLDRFYQDDYALLQQYF